MLAGLRSIIGGFVHASSAAGRRTGRKRISSVNLPRAGGKTAPERLTTGRRIWGHLPSPGNVSTSRLQRASRVAVSSQEVLGCAGHNLKLPRAGRACPGNRARLSDIRWCSEEAGSCSPSPLIATEHRTMEISAATDQEIVEAIARRRTGARQPDGRIAGGSYGARESCSRAAGQGCCGPPPRSASPRRQNLRRPAPMRRR